jgi:hypothetical protein
LSQCHGVTANSTVSAASTLACLEIDNNAH